ncbi:EAL domain-containing protein [Thalassotalea sp. M1531]|uniref:EAL domain-containing protein n=1 Tax=Thalassotalea algicola TaxID=2716224 RepID=A0A7Y0LDK4_9GAMM|nr:cache domain-containing protein [Thalassotalea algicola]NMP32589.1 EAL domain-containing protein [Thalassotalea algicola]
MKIAHDVKLLRLIKIIPPMLVTAFACLAIFIVISNNQEKLERDILALQQDFISSRKDMVQAQVKQLVEQINYEKSSTESILKNDIKQHIYQAHAIATSIYENNKSKTEIEVTKLITDALRNIRFNNGRGYFFIYKTNGLSVMHPIVPSMEGTSKIDLQDIRGNFIVKDMGELAKEHGETFYNWWFVKPDNQEKEFRKIGFGKHFVPYDWFIGTGEYLIDVENDIKNQLIQRISNIRYGENGYVFLYDHQGNTLSHVVESVLGSNVFNHPDPNINKIGHKVIEAGKKGEAFLSYLSPVMPATGKPAEKISFVQGIPEWNWVLGTGFYESETKSYLNKRKLEIEAQNKKQLIELLSLSFVVTLFFIILSFFLTRYLSKRFTDYEEKINRDFDELNSVKLESQYQALHDSLTQLPNRALLDEHIQQGIELSKRNKKMLAVMFVDLDDFKKINDLHGHSVGDSLLILLGKMFNEIIEGGDSVARFGGDEFIFCFPEISHLSIAEQKVEQILSLFSNEFDIDGKAIYSSCSIGVAMFPKDGENSEELVSKADTALYKSKSLQKGQSLFFNHSIEKQVKRDFLIETELRTALVNEELSVLYQPQISVETGDIIGVEALVRWQNDSLGFVSPAEFIPIAENTGTIHELGAFVIEKTLKEIKEFNLCNAFSLNLSINISPKQLLDPKFTESVVSICREVAFDPQFVTLEITENVLITDLSLVQPVLSKLRSSGFKLSLDDFGTGYSSLSYLSNLPMNEIKIDRSFIDKFLTNSQSESLVKTIIAIGRFCNLTVVAEGVETKAQYERLVLYHCDLIQGYYFDKPLTYKSLVERYQSSNIDMNWTG